MSIPRSVLSVAVVTVIALVGLIVLAGLRQPVPDVLPFVVVTGLGALAGVAAPSWSPRDPGQTP